MFVSHPSLSDLDLVLVQGDEFSMGNNQGEYASEKPEHPVKLSDYYIGRYPVTQRLWEAVAGKNPSGFKGDRRPVENVSWEEANQFIGQLNRRNDIKDWILNLEQPGKAFQLPTEAQWEFAARGGKESQGYTFAGSDKLKQVGWYDENSGGETWEVGLLLPNELGIYDLSGNVWEWCGDWYSDNYYEQCRKEGLKTDPAGPDGGVARVYRGGSCFHRASDCRPSYRGRLSPVFRRDNLGFRLVLSLQSVG